MSGELTPKQRSLIRHLLQAPTVSEAAQLAGISEATAFRWIKRDEFRQAYQDAGRRIFDRAISQLQASITKVRSILLAIAEDGDVSATARIAACSKLIESALRGTELQDIEARLEALEEACGLAQ